MRYLGNKTKLLNAIDRVIAEHSITGEVFCDLFSGTASVGDYFKDRYTIIANDFLYYSYVITCAKLKNRDKPQFEKFVSKYEQDIFCWLNNEANNQLDSNGFIYNNYTPKGNRMFFSEFNGRKIDTIRRLIENLYIEEAISEEEYFFLIASLIDNVMSISNTSGTYEAYFKYWQQRAMPNFELNPIVINKTDILHNNSIYNRDSNELIKEISGDILYLDPPYTVTQYASAYNILETISKLDMPSIKGIAGKRGKGNCTSFYSYKRTALDQFEDIFRQANFKHILISYSNQAVIPLQELVDMAKRFATNSVVYVDYLDYQEYKNHRSSNKGNGEKLKEVIIYFEKELSTIKSPLNYSGSKDVMLKQILHFFPKHVGTFVDVMGGAFNVGVNIVATEKVVYNEINPLIYNMIDWLLESDSNELISEVEATIKEFELDKGVKEQYLQFRRYYNEEEQTSKNLYILHMYAFQNLIRFNSKKEFNTPIGIAGYSEDMKNRIRSFMPRTHNTVLTNLDFRDIKFDEYPKDTLFYFDPPYYITTASYNDGKRGFNGWNLDDEKMLLAYMEKINKYGYKFILSNVVEHKGVKHDLLVDWCNKHNFKIHSIGQSGWRYIKNEVIIKNY